MWVCVDMGACVGIDKGKVMGQGVVMGVGMGVGTGVGKN